MIIDFEKKKNRFIIIAGMILVLIVAVSDYKTGFEISFSIFYLFPIFLVSWFVGLSAGVGFSILCAVLWFINDVFGGHHYSNPIFPYWNAAVRGFIFLITAALLSRLKHSLGIEREIRKEAMLASSAKSDFLANMSHEIRTPLNAIIGIASLLSETELIKEQKEYVQILSREGNHLLRIINDILDLSKVESGQFNIENVTFDLRRLVEESISLVGVSAHEKELELYFKIMPDVPTILVGDPGCLRRIIINLMGNAVKFTEKGLISLTIENVPEASEPCRLQFTVSDTGKGIPEEKLDQIFERFTQADATITRRYGGTGLGLSITKRLVEILGGDIKVKSIVGRGSSFYFTLPFGIAETSSDVSLMTEQSRRKKFSVQDTRPLHILLVDDNETGRRLIKAFLKKTPYIIDEAVHGKIALEKFKLGSYDLMLMDMQMPVMDGYEATKAIRAWEHEKSLKETPIVALTAHAFKEDIQKSFQAGCTAHLAKPISNDMLLETIYETTTTTGYTPHPDKSIATVHDRVVISDNLRDLMPQFLDDIHSFHRDIGEALNHEDFDSIQKASHKIKGVGGSFGFQFVSRLGDMIEKAAARQNEDGIRSLLDELSDYLEHVEVTYE